MPKRKGNVLIVPIRHKVPVALKIVAFAFLKCFLKIQTEPLIVYVFIVMFVDIYRYSSEIEYILSKYNIKSDLRICSIGCGPCSELFGVFSYKNNKRLDFAIEFTGFELNRIWEPIHSEINKLFDFNTTFIYDDIFEYYQDKEVLPNVLILNYMLSDLLKHQPEQFEEFIDKLCVLYKRMPKSIMIVNDINLGQKKNEIRWHFEPLIKKLQQENEILTAERCHFANSQGTYYSYGDMYSNNNVVVMPQKEIAEKYNTWTECRSAQLVVLKKANKP